MEAFIIGLVPIVVILLLWNINLTIRINKLEEREYERNTTDTPRD